MLNTFPDLLIFQTLAPTIIRAAVALAFLYVAYAQYNRRAEIAQMQFPIVGTGMWRAWLAVCLNVLVGAMLLFGYYTQIGAILGLLLIAKSLVLKKNHRAIAPLSYVSMLLLAAMCLSLLLSGAGALAQDLQQL